MTIATTDEQILRTCAGLGPDQQERKRDLRRWARRRRMPRRLPERERVSLGLQPGVGADDFELERARYYRALAGVICRELREAELTPLATIGFNGRPLTVEATVHPDKYTAHPDRDVQPWVKRNTSASPLDYLFFQSKARLEFWEWVAGKRFEYDWHVAHTGNAVTVSLERLLLAKQEPKARRKKGQPLPVVTFKPRSGARRPRKHGGAGISDNRLDAMARLGRLADEISKVSFYLLWEVVGRERWLKDVAATLGCQPEYVAGRFREALCEAADHYAVRATPRTRPGRVGGWSDGDKPTEDASQRLSPKEAARLNEAFERAKRCAG